MEPQLLLSKTRYLPSLENRRWQTGDAETELPESARIALKRARIDVNIVRHSSDATTKYEIFQRLNTGGSAATEQEVRSCILIMADRSFFKWIESLANDENFKACILITERSREEAYDLELVVRFIVLATVALDTLKEIADLGTFLTDESRRLATDTKFSRKKMERAFREVFEYLAETLNDEAFRRYDKPSKRYLGPMLISLYEVVAIGLGRQLLAGGSLPDGKKFAAGHKALWGHKELSPFVGSGMPASRRIPRTIAFGEKWLT